MTEYEFSADYAGRYLQLLSLADENAEELENERTVRYNTIVNETLPEEIKKNLLNDLFEEYYQKYADLIEIAKESLPNEVFENTIIYLNNLLLTNINYASSLGMRIPSEEDIPLSNKEYFSNFLKVYNNIIKLENIGKDYKNE